MVGAILAGASLAVGAVKGVSDFIEGGKREAEAMEAIEGYSRQTLRNVTSGMAVPTEGYRLKAESIARESAQAAYTVSQAGARGAVGASADIFKQIQESQNQLAASLEESEFRLKKMAAEDEARIRGMREQREREDLAALGAELEAGRSQRRGAFDTMAETLASGATVAGAM